MDESRKNRAAYDYLCRLYEVQKWLVSQLCEAIVPPPIELEEDLRNGVLLARLAHAFLPDFIKTDQIFDIEEEKYESGGLVYNHTDNIIKWRKASLEIGFPEFWIPETVDIYEGRNVR
uniref:Calponin-homology (CH) domain-containing protein n=1 Tax=Panagrolaimus sp. PS1159 TaxID=55785 RepID=A0AC35GGK6_9BILA